MCEWADKPTKKIVLAPPLKMTLERGLEIMAEDEYLEVTPLNIRLRKQYLKESERKKIPKGRNKMLYCLYGGI